MAGPFRETERERNRGREKGREGQREQAQYGRTKSREITDD